MVSRGSHRDVRPIASSVARLSSVVREASFPAGQYVPLALRVMSEVEPSDEAPDAIATRLLPRVLYASPSAEDDWKDLRSSDVGALWRDQIADAYDAALDPSSAALVVVGDSTEETLKPILDKAFGGWHAKNHRARLAVAKPVLATASPRLVVVDHPGSDTSITFVGEAPRYSTPEWTALATLHSLLLGAKGRIASALRSAKVDRAGAVLVFNENPLAPRVTLHATVSAPQTATVLATLDALLRQTKSAEIAPDELAYTQRLQLVGLQAQTATVAGAADVVEGLVIQGLPPDDVPKRAPRYVALTSGDLQRAAARYVDPDRMKIVVVGDWSKIRGEVEALGWGPVELRSSAGAILGAEGAAR
jgi:zinc protease